MLAAAAAAPCRQPRGLWAPRCSHSLGGPPELTAVVKAAVHSPGPGSLWGLCSGLGEFHPHPAAAAGHRSPVAAVNGCREVLCSWPRSAGVPGSGPLLARSGTGSGKLLDRFWTAVVGRASPALTAPPSLSLVESST